MSYRRTVLLIILTAVAAAGCTGGESPGWTYAPISPSAEPAGSPSGSPAGSPTAEPAASPSESPESSGGAVHMAATRP